MTVTPAIPASQIVTVNPSVLSAGGTALDLIGLILTGSARPPIGQVLTFADAADVSTYFGSTSQEAALGTIYFLGYDNSNVKPGSLLFAQYPLTAVSAWLRGGAISALTLTQLQAINGSLSVTVDGVVKTGTVNLSAATSFSSAATIVGDTLGIEGATTASVTGSISGTTLSVGTLGSGTVGVGNLLDGSGVTAGTYVIAQLTGTTGGTGTYTVSASQTAPNQTITVRGPGVAYDSVAGALQINGSAGATSTIGYATGAISGTLKLTQATGAVLSQGAAAGVPATAMNALVLVTTDWASFMTTFEPSSTDKEAFATWTNGQNNRYMYAMWSTNAANVAVGGPGPSEAFITTSNLSGVSMIYEDPTIDTVGAELAAFAISYPACLDFTQRQGRTTAKFRAQTGLAPQIFNATKALILEGYGINFYGDYTTANDAFVFFANGMVSGPFKWMDSYVNQIWLNNQLQLALMVLLTQARSIPYNAAGRTLIEAACKDPILQAVNFGAIQPGVTLSQQQIALVNSSAGVKIDEILSLQGWYLQVLDAIPQVRAARTSPPITLFYTDGGSIQKISLASIEVQ